MRASTWKTEAGRRLAGALVLSSLHGVAGAMAGVGPQPTAVTHFEVQLVRADLLEPLAKQAVLSRPSFSSVRSLVRSEFTASEGEEVVKSLGSGHSLRFHLDRGAQGATLALMGFELLRQENAGQRTLVRADLQVRTDRPLVLGLTRGGSDRQALLLLLTCSEEASFVPSSRKQ